MQLKFPETVQKINLLYYSIIVIVLGTPLWWYTTDTYRAALPHSQITGLTEYKTLFSIPVGVCFDPTEVQHGRVEQIIISLKPFLLSRAFNQGRVIYDIDLSIAKKCGEQSFSILFTNDVVRPSKAEISPQGLKISFDKIERMIADVAEDILNYVELTQLQNHILALDDPTLHPILQDVRNAMAVATSYNILVSVVNPDPAAIKLDYNLVEGTKQYLEPFITELGSIAEVTYQTQVMRYVKLPHKPVKSGDVYFISENNLPHLINPIESKLGTSTTNDINLIIYLMEGKYSPLVIKTKDGDMKELPSFLSPQFGAVLLYDTSNKTTIDHSTTFNVLLPQLKQLLGLKSTNSADISPQEKFFMESRATLTHILKSIDTLNSLIRLVDSIPNMVIGDHIAGQIASSVEGINKAQTALSEGKLSEALHQASLARNAAEKSFSDPSILALLYFPDDQKFAIYIPLFLPVGLPLIVAYLEILKRWKKNKDKTD